MDIYLPMSQVMVELDSFKLLTFILTLSLQ